MHKTSGPVAHILQYMNYLQKGLSVHTDNLNRADIPGATANTLKPFSDQVTKSQQQALATTNIKHISFTPSGLIHEGSTKASIELQTAASTIDREEELQKVNDISTEFLKAVRLYQKSIGLFKTILNYRG